jgi:hypothetical protein
VHTSTVFRQCSLWLAALLMGLLALGPFLHAHYGQSQATGFHINGLQTASGTSALLPAHQGFASAVSAERPWLSAPTEQESPAVSVVTSLPRFEEGDSFSADTLEVLLVSFFVLSVLRRLPRIWPGVRTVNPFVACAFQAGFPPPAHAPPLLSH